MKILIFYATYGGGHQSVANAMKEEIEKEYPEANVKVMDCMKYLSKTINSITVHGYEDLTKNMPKVWGEMYKDSRKGFIADVSNSLNKMLAGKLGKYIQEEKPDYIISAHPFSTQMCGILKSKGKLDVPVATILTDFKYHEQWLVKHEYLDKFFTSNEKMRQSLIEYGVKKEKVYATGLPISRRFLKEYNREDILEEFGLKDMKTVLFFAGGKMGLARKNITEFMKKLIENSEKAQVVAVSGKNPKIYKEFEELAKNKENVKVLEYTSKVPELMSISDLVVTKPGGITVSESLASDLPIVVINPIPGQEEENAEFLVENGLAFWIKNDSEIDSLPEIINNDEEIKIKKENIKQFR